MKITKHPKFGWTVYKNGWLGPIGDLNVEHAIANGEAQVVAYCETYRFKRICAQTMPGSFVGKDRYVPRPGVCDCCGGKFKGRDLSEFKGRNLCGSCLLIRDDEQEAVERRQMDIRTHANSRTSSLHDSCSDRTDRFA